jgi:hemoglobin
MCIVRGLIACVAALALTGSTWSQTGQAGLDLKELDQRVYNLLRDVINTGATLYNKQNDYNGCYRVYQGSLMTLRPLLDHRPGLQKVIDDAFAAADRERSVTERAFILRAAIDRVREETRGKAATAKKDTLWDRLGGEKNVRKVVDDFVVLASTNPKVDFFRDGKYKPNEEQITELKQRLVEFVSEAAGGPLKYKGKPMKEVHKGMGITDAQFNAAAADLKQALDKNGAKPADRDAVLEAVNGTRKDIVEAKEPKMPAPKKGEGKEPLKKNADGKKDGQTVRGKVTLDDKPLAGARITFVPVKGGGGDNPSAKTDDEGAFEFKGGVPKGEYNIQITSSEAKLPAVYSKADTTPLRATVPVDGSLEIVLSSEKKGPVKKEEKKPSEKKDSEKKDGAKDKE